MWLEPFFFAPPPPATFDLSQSSFWRELVGTVRTNYKPPAAQTTAAGGGGGADGANGGNGGNSNPALAGAPSAASAAELEGDGDGGGEELPRATLHHPPEDKTDAWLSTCLVPAAGQGGVRGRALSGPGRVPASRASQQQQAHAVRQTQRVRAGRGSCED